MIARDKFVGAAFDSRVYVLADANFNVTAIVNSSGTVLERYVYDPYGTFTVVNSSWASPGASSHDWVYLHQGGRWDDGADKYHFRRRDYDSALMRWAEVDPIGFQAGDSDLYRYERNAVPHSLDSFGLKTCTLFMPPDVKIGKETGWKAVAIELGSEWRDIIPNGGVSPIKVKVVTKLGCFRTRLLNVKYNCTEKVWNPCYAGWRTFTYTSYQTLTQYQGYEIDLMANSVPEFMYSVGIELDGPLQTPSFRGIIDVPQFWTLSVYQLLPGPDDQDRADKICKSRAPGDWPNPNSLLPTTISN